MVVLNLKDSIITNEYRIKQAKKRSVNLHFFKPSFQDEIAVDNFNNSTCKYF